MKTIKYLIVTAAVFLGSCSSWLDTEHSEMTTAPKLYSTEAGINSALNGIYMKLAGASLYGTNLTHYYLEIMGQAYVVRSNHSEPRYYEASVYNYNHATTRLLFDELWGDMYNAVSDINVFIGEMENNTVIPAAKRDILLGEAYGLRAYVHFDILRIWGPVYSENPDMICMPYYEEDQVFKNPRLKASEIVEKVRKDIAQARELLAADPIRTEGVLDSSVDDPVNDFYRFRNKRFNFFAADALEARVLLHTGKKTEAAALARKLLTGIDGVIPFIDKADILSDMRFTAEAIFSIENQDYYKMETLRYKDAVAIESNLAVQTATIKWAFSGDVPLDNVQNADDERKALWKNYVFPSYETPGNRDFQITTKFVKSTTIPTRYTQPMIRRAELYYIIAEAENDVAQINVLRKARGVINDVTASTAFNELIKEHYREMIGDGQLFHLYKRNGAAQMVDNSSQNPTALVWKSMAKSNYVVPVPDLENSIY